MNKRNYSTSSLSSYSEHSEAEMQLHKMNSKSQIPKKDSKSNLENEESSENKKYMKIINMAKKQSNKYKEYPKLKYKDHIYSLNETIMISNCDDPENDFIAILRKIMRAVHQGCLHIIVEVQW